MATINSNGTGGGDWHVGATWSGGSVPGDTDRVVILSGDTVEIDADTTIGDTPAAANDWVIDVEGTLKWKDNPSGNWTLSVRGSTRIKENGVLSIGTDANPIPADKIATVDVLGHDPNYRFPSFGQVTTTGADAPIFRTRGEVAYHMGDEEKYRARLVSGVTAGDDVAIELDRAVDWEVGDILFFGRGGSQTVSILTGGALTDTYNNERTTISGKTDATHYTVTHLDDDHVDGDIVAHATRNIIIQSDETYGFSMWNDPGNDSDAKYATVDLSWTRLRYLGGVDDIYGRGIYIYGANNDALEFSDSYHIVGCAFDEVGGPASTFFIFNRCRNARVVQQPLLDKVVMYAGGKYGIMLGESGYGLNNAGKITFGDVVVIGGYPDTIYIRDYFLEADSLWLTYHGAATSNSQACLYLVTDDNFCTVKCGELLCHGGYHGIRLGTTQRFDIATDFIMLSGELYNTEREGVQATNNYGRRLFYRNVKFAHTGYSALDTPLTGTLEFYGCEFDNIGRNVVIITPRVGIKVLFKSCKFGMISQNYRSIMLYKNSGGVSQHISGYLRIEDCEFKETTSPFSYGDWGFSRATMITDDGGDAPIDYRTNRAFTLQFVRPKVYDASDVDQWPIEFPDVDYMAYFGGGGECRNEDTVVIDGSYGMKFTPWYYQASGAGSYAAPYKIPVQSGQTLTVKISLRKTRSQAVQKKRPKALIQGCGIFDEVSMPDTNDTWEELTLSGTADKTGMVYFWVEPGFGFYDGLSLRDRWYQTVYADKLVVTAT